MGDIVVSWYFVDNEEKVGPFEDAEFHELVSRGRIADDTLVWQKGMREWEPYENVMVIKIAVQIPEAAPENGGEFSPESLLAPLSEDTSDQWDTRAVPGAPGALHYASFGSRLMARMIDSFIVGAIFAVLTVGMAVVIGSMASGDPEAGQGAAVVVVLLVNVMAFVFPIVYSAFFVARSGATPGKMAMGLKVVRPNGYDVSTGQAWGRAFADLLSQITMGIGYLLVLFDEEKRALHDHICGTRVISTR